MDRSKRFTLFASPGRPVHSDTNSASPGSILATQQLRAKAKSLTFPPLSIDRYSFIQLSEQGRQWRERKCPIFETVTKRDSNPGSLDCESGILPLSYRAPLSVECHRVVLGTSSSYCIWEELVKLSTGFSVYKLYLNVTTTNYMVFGNIKRITDIVVLVFRALRDLAPAYVSTLITPYETRGALRSPGSALLCVPRHNLERYGRRSFSCAGPVLWNSLPEDMRLAD